MKPIQVEVSQLMKGDFVVDQQTNQIVEIVSSPKIVKEIGRRSIYSTSGSVESAVVSETSFCEFKIKTPYGFIANRSLMADQGIQVYYEAKEVWR